MAKLTYYLNVTGYSSYINSSILSKSLGTTYLGGTSSNVLALNRSYIPSVSFTKYAGIDVPTLIKDTTKNNTDVIVFVGESPTRDSWHYPANGKGKVGQDIIVGAPFGVNWAKNTKDGLDIYTEIFDHCLSHNRNYDVYVTDVNKLWTDQMEFKTPQLVSSPTMLANEINNILGLYQNVYIVCFGNESDDFFNKNMNNSLRRMQGGEALRTDRRRRHGPEARDRDPRHRAHLRRGRRRAQLGARGPQVIVRFRESQARAQEAQDP